MKHPDYLPTLLSRTPTMASDADPVDIVKQEGRTAMFAKRLLINALPRLVTLALMAGFIWTGLQPGFVVSF